MKKDYELKPRIRWSDFMFYHPIKLMIPDWSNLRRVWYKYMLIDSIMDYKGRKIELCVPYSPFIVCIRKLPKWQQVLIRDGKAMIELERVPRDDSPGLIIRSVKEWIREI